MTRDTFISKIAVLFPTSVITVDGDKAVMRIGEKVFYGGLSDDPGIQAGAYKVTLARFKEGYYQ